MAERTRGAADYTNLSLDANPRPAHSWRMRYRAQRYLMPKYRVLAFAAGICFSAAAFAQGNSQAGGVRQLNNELLRLHGLMQRAAPAEQAVLRGQAAPVIERREAALSAAVAENPGEALRVGFPQNLLADLASKFPQASARLESRASWSGRLESIIEDGVNFTTHREIRRLHVNGRVFDLHFSGPEPARLECGYVLTVSGMAAGNRIAVEQATVTQAAAAATCGKTGEQKVAVILVNFPSAVLPSNVNADLLNGIFLGNAYTTVANSPDWSISDFWFQNSDGKTWVTPPAAPGGLKIVGPYNLAQNYDYCTDSTALRQAAYAAANADLNFAEYARVVIVVPNYACPGTAGVATIGCWPGECPGDGVCGTSWTWWRGDQMNSRTLGVRLGTHEMGHNLGMGHSGSRGHGNEVLGPLNVAGTRSEYGDSFGTMGSWNFGFYNGSHSVNQLGWLSTANYQTVTAGGTYSVQAFDARPAGVKALRIRRGASTDSSWLWLGYYPRDPIYHSQLGAQVSCGAILHYQDLQTPPGKTDLLDFTPTSTGGHGDPALCVGQTWQDPYTGLTLRIDSAAGSMLNVTVNYAVGPCVEANPTVTLAPSSLGVNEGSSGAYTVTVRNNDSASCAPRAFNLSHALNPPSALLSGSFSPVSLTVEPGAQANSSLAVSAQAGSSGSYTASATAAAGTSTGAGSAGLSVTVAPLAPPSNLTASASYSGSGKKKTLDGVTLNWTAPAGQAQFRIERCTLEGKGNNKACTYTGAALAYVPADARTYVDTTAPAGATCKYRVRAEIDATRYSAWAETQVTVR